MLDIDGTSATIVLPQPYATTIFANLLVELSSTLQDLTLSTSTFRLVMGLALNEEPHRGSLDFALSYCTHLTSLFIPWQLTSTKFLTSLAKLQHLDELTMQGHPPASCDPNEFSEGFLPSSSIVLQYDISRRPC